MNMLEFDEENLVETAKAVLLVNPFVSDMSVDQLVQRMKDTANRTNWSKYGYVSTLGFVLTAYPLDKKTTGIKASVSAFSVIRAMEALKTKETV
jgi:deoxyribodipyrimidine photolyase-like uncharacterized protein